MDAKHVAKKNPAMRKVNGILKANGSSTNKFKVAAMLIHGDLYDYSKVVYKNKNTKVIIICKTHGEFKQTPNAHLNGKQGCPKCSIERIGILGRLTQDQVIKKFRKIHGNTYIYNKVVYISYNKKVIITCRIHGDFKQKPNNHIDNKNGCPKCGNLSRRVILTDTCDVFIGKAKLIHDNLYTYEYVDYINSRVKVKINCQKHGIFKQRPNLHISGQGCPKCNNSKGEMAVEKYLKENGYKYKPQKKFKKCVNKRKLPFDFYLPELNLCIEYDGKQHFEPVDHFGGEDAFILQQIKDSIKNEYCHQYNRGLIRIPYTVEDRLCEFLDYFINEYRMNKLIERIEHLEVQLNYMQKI